MCVFRKFSLLILLTVLALVGPFTSAAKKKEKKAEAGFQAMSEHQRALHALNRLTFGARPGDVERVLALGVDKWIDLELHPERIDDSALETRLSPLRTLRMDTRAMLENFPPPQLVKEVADGRAPMPTDPEKRAIYEAQLERLREQQERKQERGAQPAQLSGAPPQSQNPQATVAPGSADQAGAGMSAADEQARREQRVLAQRRAGELMQMPSDQRFREWLRMSGEQRRALAGLPPQQREQLMAGFTPQQRETVMALAEPQMVIVSELQQGKLLRAIYSERQLEEVMADFWFNHFNVFLGKGPERYLITGYERDVIRPHVLGKFKDLLIATAKSPAMLFYLDNWMSVGPDSDFANHGPERRAQNRAPRAMRPRAGMGVGWGPWGPRWRAGMRAPLGGNPVRPRPAGAKAPGQNKRIGLNENYARELMELHTLGVNGGYTQKDVTEVAKVFTGWTLKQPRQGGQFEFDERKHEPGTKTVLGHAIQGHGEDEGLQVLDLLAHQSATARFISTKLAQRFVSDDPPPALVDRMAKKFRDSDGDIREVLRTLFRSPEFWSPQTYRAKVKTPLEFVASAVRSGGADVQNATPLVQTLNRMGMQPYGSQPPTGYPMNTSTWMNSAALLNRLNFAMALAAGRMPGISLDTRQLLSAYLVDKHKRVVAAPGLPMDPEAVLARLEDALLAGDVSRQTHQTIRRQLQERQVKQPVWDDAGSPPDVDLIAALIFGSPEFQRR